MLKNTFFYLELKPFINIFLLFSVSWATSEAAVTDMKLSRFPRETPALEALIDLPHDLHNLEETPNF